MSEGEPSQKSGGLFGALRSILVEDEPGSPTPAPAPAQAPTAPVRFAAHATSDPAVRKALEKDVGEAAKPAYSEFMNLSTSMAGVLPDERVRFQAVLAAMTSKNLSVEQVLIDIDECFQALDKKEADAARAAAAERTKRVGAREGQIADLNKKIDELRAQVAGLEIDRTRLETEVSSETEAIETVERAFAATVTAYRAELQETKNKIKSLRGAG